MYSTVRIINSLVPSRKNRRKNSSGNIVHYSWYFSECNQGVNWRNWSHIEARIVNECTCRSHFPSSELQWLKNVAFLLARSNSYLNVWKFERVSRLVCNVTRRIFRPIFSGWAWDYFVKRKFYANCFNQGSHPNWVNWRDLLTLCAQLEWRLA